MVGDMGIGGRPKEEQITSMKVARCFGYRWATKVCVCDLDEENLQRSVMRRPI